MPDTVITMGWRGLGAQLAGPAELVEGLAGQLPPFWSEGGRPVVRATLTRQGELVQVSLPQDLSVTAHEGEALRAGASRVELLVGSELPDRALVHAGVVAFEAGAVVVPGRSMAGKSTLVAALVRAGGAYVSDEFAVLDRDGLVHPYPRWLTQRTPAGSVRVDPATLGEVATRPSRVAAVAGLQWSESGWQVEQLSPGRGALALVEHCVTARRDPALALDALAAACAGAHCLQGTRGEADDAAARLQLLASASHPT